MAHKKTWKEKFNTPRKVEIRIAGTEFSDIPAGSKILIASPQLVDDYIRGLERGSIVDIKTIRHDLALREGADFACPLSTGYFLRIAAEAAFEEHLNGMPLSLITPFWRAIPPNTLLMRKLTCGAQFVLTQQRFEKIPDRLELHNF